MCIPDHLFNRTKFQCKQHPDHILNSGLLYTWQSPDCLLDNTECRVLPCMATAGVLCMHWSSSGLLLGEKCNDVGTALLPRLLIQKSIQ